MERRNSWEVMCAHMRMFHGHASKQMHGICIETVPASFINNFNDYDLVYVMCSNEINVDDDDDGGGGGGLIVM